MLVMTAGDRRDPGKVVGSRSAVTGATHAGPVVAAHLDEEGAVVGIERVQPAPMVENPRPRGAATAQVSASGSQVPS
jgi:hypothetical protein